MKLLKITLFGVMQCVYCGLSKKNIYIFSTYCTFCCFAFLKMYRFFKAYRSMKRGLLWLASYPVGCDWLNTSSVRWKSCAPYRIVDSVSRCDDTKTIKPIINEPFVASSGDTITDYNDFILSFYASRCIRPRKHYHVCICDLRNDKQQELLYTAQNSRLNP